MLGGDEGGQLVEVGLDQLLELEDDAGALQRRGGGPGREGGLAAATAWPTSAVLANGTCAAISPVAGL